MPRADETAHSSAPGDEYLYALLLRARQVALPLAMSNPLTTDDAPWNLLMAVSVVSSLPPVCLSDPVRRHPTAGLVSGAVAGT